MTLPPVKFDRPPVVEVVCGVLFDDLTKLRVPHIGLYWSTIRDEFPVAEERPLLDPVIEVSGPPTIALQVLSAPPMPRVWLVSEEGRNLIQIQRDRFLYNWKRADESDSYPSYDVVSRQFEKHLAGFRAFLTREQIGDLTFRQFELTYVNHIGLSGESEHEHWRSVLIDHVRDDGRRERFLPDPEGFSWRTVYALPGKNGRLHVLAQSATKEGGQRIVRLNMIARGLGDDTSDQGRAEWFALAHEWITRGFVDVTSPVIQKEVWRRTQ